MICHSLNPHSPKPSLICASHSLNLSLCQPLTVASLTSIAFRYLQKKEPSMLNPVTHSKITFSSGIHVACSLFTHQAPALDLYIAFPYHPQFLKLIPSPVELRSCLHDQSPGTGK
ncbi:uncharacterized protein LOC130935878 [Arachis stenosperma]|uniref:uncharacterized protein LOC130935878 n=1 Tax=Arachis stenosperma TaxID=217475 RepID=UPI0025AC32E1|nr:uncharacterized protein LOC130935878 [Arachis stenosperma]